MLISKVARYFVVPSLHNIQSIYLSSCWLCLWGDVNDHSHMGPKQRNSARDVASQLARARQHYQIAYLNLFRSSYQRCSIVKVFLEIFKKFTSEKHLICQSLFFDKVTGLRPATLLKRRLWYSFFPVNFAKFLRTRFSLHCSQNTS